MLWNGQLQAQNLKTIENLGLTLKINSAPSDKSLKERRKEKIPDACVEMH